MNQTKKLTVSAILVALGALFNAVGAFFEIADLTSAALASLCVVLVYIEIGSPHTWLVWLATSLVTILIAPAGSTWPLYLFIFGVFPILKGYIERLKRGFWIPLKLLFCNIALLIVALICELLLGLPLFGDEAVLGISPELLRIPLWIFFNIAFLLYDYFLTVMARFYLTRLRSKFQKYLK